MTLRERCVGTLNHLNCFQFKYANKLLIHLKWHLTTNDARKKWPTSSPLGLEQALVILQRRFQHGDEADVRLVPQLPDRKC